MHKLKVLFSIALVTILFFCGGCAKQEKKTIKIGLAAPLTGSCAQFGDMIKKGAEMKVSEINQTGGINGKKLILVEGDDAANPQEASTIAQKFCADKEILAVVGHFNSSCSLAGKPIYKAAGLVELSPGSTNPAVCKGSEWTFRNIYEDVFQGVSLANYVYEKLGFRTITVFYDNDDYGIGLKDAFCKEAERIGLQVLGAESYERDTVDFRAQLLNFKRLNPDGIFISGLYEEGAQIISQARKLGLDTQFFGADGLLSSDLIRIGGEHVEGTILTCPFLFELGGKETKDFVENFTKRYGVEPDCWAALTYDAVGIIAHAIQVAGEDRRKIRDHLASMTSPDTAYPGITGLTFFDENGDCQKPIHVAVVKGGKFVPAPIQIMK
jgi:branched-chain amino acid transport system substrate-binding protein